MNRTALVALFLAAGLGQAGAQDAAAGEKVSIATSSKDYFDTIVVLLAPDGTPLVGGDDFKGYFAGFDWVASAAATYRLRVTFFESIITGSVVVARN